MTADECLRALAAAGRLEHLLIVRDKGGRGFQASLNGERGYTVGIDPDPVRAVLQAAGHRSPRQTYTPDIEDLL